MEYFIAFLTGFGAGHITGALLMWLIECMGKRRIPSLQHPLVREVRICAKCMKLKPWGPHLINLCEECLDANIKEHTTNLYEGVEEERAKYRTMWGPRENKED